MHLQTHVLSGWLLGNCFRLSPRERLFCMVAAAVPDLDGAGIVFGWETYLDYHHVLGHNLPVAVVAAAVMAVWSSSRLKAFAVYFGLFHLHLLLDLFGSGELWTIKYFWPFSPYELSTSFSWEFYSWQNLTAGGIAVALTLAIAIRQRRTPLEYVMPKLDRQLVELLVRGWRKLSVAVGHMSER